MRVTESRLIDMATEGVTRGRDAVGKASTVITSGNRVAVPSDDPAAWAAGQRASARKIASESRGGSIQRAQSNLEQTDGALATIDNAAQTAHTLAIQLVNGSITASDRINGATQIRALRATALAAANTQGPDGEYLLAGNQSFTAPFTAAGVYQGDASQRPVEVGEEGATANANLPGSRLTVAGGGAYDLFAELDKLATAFDNNDIPGIQAGIQAMNGLVAQVADARATVGTQIQTLQGANETRTALEQHLAEVHGQAVEADPVQAASNLSQAQQALEAARAAAQQLVNIASSATR